MKLLKIGLAAGALILCWLTLNNADALLASPYCTYAQSWTWCHHKTIDRVSIIGLFGFIALIPLGWSWFFDKEHEAIAKFLRSLRM